MDSESAPRAAGSAHGASVRSSASYPLNVIAIGVCIGFTWWLRPVLAPIALAWLAKIALTPIVRMAKGRRIPTSLSAGFLVASMLGGTTLAFVALSEPANEWVKRLPDDIDALRLRWVELSEPSQEVSEVMDSFDELVDTTSNEEAVTVTIADSTPLVVKALNEARSLLAQFALFLVLTYFLLANDRVLADKWMRISRTEDDAKVVQDIFANIEQQCGTYLISITVINVGLGILVGCATAALGLPNAVLWGAMAATLNFVPFLGAVVGIAVVLIAGISTHPTILAGVLPAAAYLFLTAVEGLFVTPSIVGRSIRLSPVAVLIWIMLWGWIWGLPGALLAVPLLSAVTIICRHVPRWNAFAELVEG